MASPSPESTCCLWLPTSLNQESPPFATSEMFSRWPKMESKSCTLFWLIVLLCVSLQYSWYNFFSQEFCGLHRSHTQSLFAWIYRVFPCMHFSLVNSNIHSTTLSELQFSNLLSHVMAAVTFLLDGERVSLSSLYGRQPPWPVLFISLPAMLFLVLIFTLPPSYPRVLCAFTGKQGDRWIFCNIWWELGISVGWLKQRAENENLRVHKCLAYFWTSFFLLLLVSKNGPSLCFPLHVFVLFSGVFCWLPTLVSGALVGPPLMSHTSPLMDLCVVFFRCFGLFLPWPVNWYITQCHPEIICSEARMQTLN